MELKLDNTLNLCRISLLLIVPYGIEIRRHLLYHRIRAVLLIVPYGIEICD